MIQHPSLTQKIKPTTGDPVQDTAANVVVHNDILSNETNDKAIQGNDKPSNNILIATSNNIQPNSNLYPDNNLLPPSNNNLPGVPNNNKVLPTTPNDKVLPTLDTTNLNESDSNKDHKHKKEEFKMETLLHHANKILKHHFNENFIKQNNVPSDLFEKAKGIILLSYWKAGLVIGGSYGTGVLLCKQNEQWCGPCAVSLGGMQFGLNIGFEKVDLALIINDDMVLQSFEANGVFAIGGDASIAIGPFGKDNNLIAKGSSAIYAYSFSKGAYIGLSFHGGNIKIENDWNTAYYETRTDFNKISTSDVVIPNNDDFVSIIHTLDEFHFGQDRCNIPLPSVDE